jgi:hypothetical protein
VILTTLSPDLDTFEYDEDNEWMPVRRRVRRVPSLFFDDEEEGEQNDSQKAPTLNTPRDDISDDSTIEDVTSPDTPERRLVLLLISELEEFFAHVPYQAKPSLGLEYLSHKLSRMLAEGKLKALWRNFRILRDIGAPAENVAYLFHDAYSQLTTGIAPPDFGGSIPRPMTPRSLVVRLRSYMTPANLRTSLAKNQKISSYLEARARLGDTAAMRDALEMAEISGTPGINIAKNFEAAWRILENTH